MRTASNGWEAGPPTSNPHPCAGFPPAPERNLVGADFPRRPEAPRPQPRPPHRATPPTPPGRFFPGCRGATASHADQGPRAGGTRAPPKACPGPGGPLPLPTRSTGAGTGPTVGECSAGPSPRGKGGPGRSPRVPRFTPGRPVARALRPSARSTRGRARHVTPGGHPRRKGQIRLPVGLRPATNRCSSRRVPGRVSDGSGLHPPQSGWAADAGWRGAAGIAGDLTRARSQTLLRAQLRPRPAGSRPYSGTPSPAPGAER